MKVKNSELLGLAEDLGHLVTEKIKLKIKGDTYLLMEHLKPFIDSYNKVKNEFVKKHGSGNEKKGYSISPNEWDKLSKEVKKEWEDLNEQEQEVESRLKLELLEELESSHPYQFLFKVLGR